MKKYYYALFITLCSMSIGFGQTYQPDEFVTLWKTNNPGTSNVSSITIPTNSLRTYNYQVDWDNDGVYDEFGITGDVTHDFGGGGIFRIIRIKGIFPRINFKNEGDKDKILTVVQWGNNPWESMREAFYGCSELYSVDNTSPNLSSVSDMTRMFAGTSLFNSDINSWDVSNVKHMGSMFEGASIFNKPLDSWNVGSVENFGGMFQGANSFNQELNSWDVSSATTMGSMFANAIRFNQPLNNWDVSSVISMSSMFSEAAVFNQPLNSWNLISVENMDNMLNNSGISILNYDTTLTGWKENTNTPDDLTFGANGLKYCTSENDRNYLLITKDWTITDDSKNCDNDPTNDFVITIKTDNAGDVFAIPTFRGETYNYDIDWENDGTFEVTGFTDDRNPKYAFTTAGTHTIRIRGTFPRIYFNDEGDKDKLLAVNQWGSNPWVSMENAFYGCSNFNIVASDVPNLVNVTKMTSMFRDATVFNASLNDWDVSSVTDMGYIFSSASSFNQSLNDWDVSSVTIMSGMFFNTYNFNQPLDGWNVNKVTSMDLMFGSAAAFNQTLNQWDVSNVDDMSLMFGGTTAFNQPLNSWNLSSALNMDNMLYKSGMSILNYDATLIGWKENTNTPENLTFGAGELEYCASENDRDYLITTKGWAITGDSKNCDNDPIDDFVITFKINNAGDTFTIPTFSEETYNYAVDWGNDGTFEKTGITGNTTHNFTTSDIYTIRIRGVFPRIYFNNEGSKDQIIAVNQWGKNPWTSMENAFYGCSNFNGVASDVPNLDNVTNMTGIFAKASTFNQPLNSWNVSNVIYMGSMFQGASSFNQPLDKWDVSSVTNMFVMFDSASKFNQPLNSWDVSSVENMHRMFDETPIFNQPLDSWNLSSVTYTVHMLSNTGISTINYDATLTGWKENTNTPSNITLGAFGLKYCASENDRQYLIATKGWTITSDSKFCDPTDDFVITFKIDNAGDTFTIPTFSGETYNYEVDWDNDGAFEETGITGNTTHNFTTAGTYRIRIRGVFPRIYFNAEGDRNKLLAVNQWGNNPWASMESAFFGCSNFNGVASDVPNLGNVTSMNGMFGGASTFNQPLNDWNVSSVTDMRAMFFKASSFNQPLDKWDVSSVTNMFVMFDSASKFNQPLNSWDVSSVENMHRMFDETPIFNQPLDSWNVSNVTDMSFMFNEASAFNQSLNDWNVSNVTKMFFMFYKASSFDQPLDSWDVSSVENMIRMFDEASTFNQPLDSWNVSSVTNMEGMLNATASLSTTNYDATLTGWKENTNTPSNITLGAFGLKYCASENDRQYLIDTKGWTITEDSKDCTSLSIADDVFENNLKLYPNPTTGYVSIEGVENILNSTIYNIQGQKINKKIENNKINLENVPSGIYLLKIETEKGIVTKKIIKK